MLSSENILILIKE